MLFFKVAMIGNFSAAAAVTTFEDEQFQLCTKHEFTISDYDKLCA